MLRVGVGRGMFARATESTADAPAISCDFPMDADATEVMGVGYYAKMTTSEGDQKASWTVDNTLGAERYVAAFQSGTFATFINPIDLNADGKKTVEIVFEIPTLETGTSNNLLTIKAYLYGIFEMDIICVADGEFSGTLFGAAQAYVITKGSMSPGTLRLTLEIDTDAGTFGARLNGGALLTLSNANFSKADASCFVEVIQANGGLIAASDNGKVISAHFLTSSADIIGPVTSGYGDACGNAL